MRTRLRQQITADYQQVRDNFAWQDHILRLMVTAGAIAWQNPKTVLDPACGDGSIVEAAHHLMPIEHAYLYDVSVPQINALDVSMPHTKGALSVDEAEWPDVDLVVLTEILEHVYDPDALVSKARRVGKLLVASSPLDERVSDNNHEHLWAWDKVGYQDMLRAGGWNPIAYTEISLTPDEYPYTFQVWVCK